MTHPRVCERCGHVQAAHYEEGGCRDCPPWHKFVDAEQRREWAKPIIATADEWPLGDL
jgi:hypothetical protein